MTTDDLLMPAITMFILETGDTECALILALMLF